MSQWFVRSIEGHDEWVEGPFESEAAAREHAHLLTRAGCGAPTRSLRTIPLCDADMEVVTLRAAAARLMRHQAQLAEALDLGEDDDLSAELVGSRDEAKRALGR